MPDPLIIRVEGTPAPSGSKTTLPIYRGDGSPVTKNGRVVLRYVNAADLTKGKKNQTRDWRKLVRMAAIEALGGVTPEEPYFSGPVRLSIRFRLRRPKAHFGTGRNWAKLKPSAPYWHTVKPDSTKLLRGTEDELTGLIWRDDSAVQLGRVEKVYGEPGATIRVEALDSPVVEQPEEVGQT